MSKMTTMTIYIYDDFGFDDDDENHKAEEESPLPSPRQHQNPAAIHHNRQDQHRHHHQHLISPCEHQNGPNSSCPIQLVSTICAAPTQLKVISITIHQKVDQITPRENLLIIIMI